MATPVNLIAKIENKSIERLRRISLICGIALLISTLQRLLFASTIQLGSWGWWVDTVAYLWIALFSLYQRMKLKARSEQFIEWKLNEIVYKLKDNDSYVTIDKSEIQDIEFEPNKINIKCTNGQGYKLDISDYGTFRIQAQIKENFLRIKEEINNLNAN